MLSSSQSGLSLLWPLVVLVTIITPGVQAAITINGIDAQYFNVISDVFAKVVALIFGIVVAYLYQIILTLHMRQKRSIPVPSLGGTPSSPIDAFQAVRKVGWSVYSVFFVSVIAMNELSHIMTDLGLDFETVSERGDPVDVVTLDPERRNSDLLIQAVGDPVQAGSDVFSAELYYGGDAGTYDQDLTTAFLSTVDGIARAESHLLSQESRFARSEPTNTRGQLPYPHAGLTEKSPTDNNVYDHHIWLANGTSFITGIDWAIPVECDGVREISQVQGLDNTDFRNSTALVPNCTFGSLRELGIYENPRPRRSEITAWFWKDRAGNEAGTDSGLGLIFDGSFVTEFSVKRSARSLARQRPDWKRGRELFGIKGIQLGNMTIPLKTVVLASGGEYPGSVGIGGGLNSLTLTRRSMYILVGEVDGDCPPEPGSGTQDRSCITVSKIACETFPEDYVPQAYRDNMEIFQSIAQLSPDSSACTYVSLEILWGRNFEADAQLVIAVAGVYARNAKSITDAVNQVYFSLHVIPAALFSLSSVDTWPGVQQGVRPVINGLYIFFILLPLILSIICLVLVLFLNHRKAIFPVSFWDMMILGTEIDPTLLPPPRENTKKEFPPENETLHIGYLPGGAHDELVVSRKQDFVSQQSNPPLPIKNQKPPK